MQKVIVLVSNIVMSPQFLISAAFETDIIESRVILGGDERLNEGLNPTNAFNRAVQTIDLSDHIQCVGEFQLLFSQLPVGQLAL